MRRTVLHALLVGYAAMLVGPAAVLLPGPTWPLFGAGCLLGGVAGAVILTRIDPAETLDTVPVSLLGMTVPLGWVYPAVTRTDSVVELVVSPWAVGVISVAVWLLAVILAHDTRHRERLEAARTVLEFTARAAPDERRQLKIAVSVLVGVVLVVSGVVAVFSGDYFTIAIVLPTQIPIWVAVMQNANEREVAVTDDGLRVQQSIHDWATITGVELTDEAISFERRGWWRSGFAFDREDIDDPEAVVAAVREYC